MGTYTWANGDSYEGHWDNGEQSGVGTFRYAINDVYEGNWARGRKNGRGFLFVAAEGKVYFEVWRQAENITHVEVHPAERDSWPSLEATAAASPPSLEAALPPVKGGFSIGAPSPTKSAPAGRKLLKGKRGVALAAVAAAPEAAAAAQRSFKHLSFEEICAQAQVRVIGNMGYTVRSRATDLHGHALRSCASGSLRGLRWLC